MKQDEIANAKGKDWEEIFEMGSKEKGVDDKKRTQFLGFCGNSRRKETEGGGREGGCLVTRTRDCGSVMAI